MYCVPKNMCCIKVHTKEYKIIELKWVPLGAVLVFENFIVRYPGQNISISSFFNHIWTHLPPVNGNPLELFMSCNNISQGLLHTYQTSKLFSNFVCRFENLWVDVVCHYESQLFNQELRNCAVVSFLVQILSWDFHFKLQ